MHIVNSGSTFSHYAEYDSSLPMHGHCGDGCGEDRRYSQCAATCSHLDEDTMARFRIYGPDCVSDVLRESDLDCDASYCDSNLLRAKMGPHNEMPWEKRQPDERMRCCKLAGAGVWAVHKNPWPTSCDGAQERMTASTAVDMMVRCALDCEPSDEQFCEAMVPASPGKPTSAPTANPTIKLVPTPAPTPKFPVDNGPELSPPY